MLKKLLILPILWSILWLGAFASATDLPIATSCGDSDQVWYYTCTPSSFSLDEATIFSSSNVSFVCPSWNCMWSYINDSEDDNYYIYYKNWQLVFSLYWEESSSLEFPAWSYSAGYFNDEVDNYDVFSSLTLWSSSSSDSSDSSLGIPEIPASFTSGLTSLVNNFGGTIANWLPTIILVALGIYAIFALFRVVRNYARSSFRG